MRISKNININTRELILCSLFSALIAVGAFIKIPIPLVPFTLQFLFTTLAGLLLGSRLGTISVIIYIVAGLLGFPVFTGGGGIGYIMQPTFGYIIGFAAGAYITGRIREKLFSLNFKGLILAVLAGLGIVYLLGMVYYYLIANFYMNSPIGIWALFLYCFILAVPGDIAICFISAILAKRLLPILNKTIFSPDVPKEI